MGSENKFYVCKLRAIINGPSEQTLNQIAKCFEIQRNLETIVDIGVTLMNKHMVADLNRDPNQGRFKLKLSLYRFNTQPTSGEAALSVTVKVIEPALDTDGYEIESEMNCHILPKDLVAVGYFGYTSPIEGMPRSSKTLRLKMFKYHHSSNEVSKRTDEVHEIDREFLAQLPELPIYSPLISWDEPRVTFGMHRNRIFCMTSLRSCKPVLQVYCFYRNKIVAAKGKNLVV